MKTFWSCLFVSFAVLPYLDADCIFPTTLQGTWIGENNDRLTFTSDALTGFRLNVPRLSESDFACVSSYVEGESTKYVLRAKDSVTIFGVRPVLYMCLEIKNGAVIYYAIDTSKNPILQDNVYATLSGGIPSLQTVCNLSGQTGTAIYKEAGSLRRQAAQSEDSVESLLNRLRQKLENEENL